MLRSICGVSFRSVSRYAVTDIMQIEDECDDMVDWSVEQTASSLTLDTNDTKLRAVRSPPGMLMLRNNKRQYVYAGVSSPIRFHFS